MKIVIPGGSGAMGGVLARHFHERGDEVVVLSRTPVPQPWHTVAWDGRSVGPWADECDGADVVINLAGRSVNCRYTPENRRQIMDSRVASTQAVGQAIAQAVRPPALWLQASTATIYAHTFGPAHDESTGKLGGNEPGVPETWRFSIDVAMAWEAAAQEAVIPHTRQVLMRTSILMGPERGGPFDILLGLVRRGLGGRSGDGKQYVSWIHELDFVRSVDWLIEHEDLSGAINIAAPNPLPNAEFMADLRRAWGIRFGLGSMRWMLEVGAVFLGTETELILKSRRVIPGRLMESGFTFSHPVWAEAAADLCQRWGLGHEESIVGSN